MTSETHVLIKTAMHLMRVDKPLHPDANLAIQREFVVRRKMTERENGRLEVFYIEEPCYELVKNSIGNQFYVMGIGFLEKLEEVLRRHGLQPLIINAALPTLDEAWRLLPESGVLSEIPLRDGQRQVMRDMLHHTHGQYVASTGSGKSFLIRNYCRVYPRSRILITTYSTTVLMEMYESVMADGRVDAGIYCSKLKRPGGRVQFCTVGCLGHFRGLIWDTLLLDEKHECATLNKMAALMEIRSRRAYAFSANHNQREDEADGWLEALFGRSRVEISHQEAVDDGDIVPVRVLWRNVDAPAYLKKLDASSPVFERYAFWDNQHRNQLVANIAENCAANKQTLVYVKTIEHIYRLRLLLDCPVVHAPMGTKEWRALQRLGLAATDERNPTNDDFHDIKHRFSQGDIPLVICNSVWKRGVNFPQLTYLIRADASGTYQDATQISGRLTRKFTDKSEGYLIDFTDKFHSATEERANRRRRAYKKIGYQQDMG